MTHTKNPDWLATLPEKVVGTTRSNGESPILLVCEHASRLIPEGLGRLGLDETAARSHIAWDPGALKVAYLLSEALDATLVEQKISRLVYDCNRPPSSGQAIRDQSEIYAIPGNTGLSPRQRADRISYIYKPFHQVLAQQVATRSKTVLVTIHSFTPVYEGRPRSVEIGILHDSDSRLADAMLDVAAKKPAYKASRNAPYGPEDGVTHTLTEHGVSAGLLNVMVEIRNDLISDEAGQRAVSAWLADILTSALKATSGGK
ncbi:MAG: N-formylglutamate amidohydrolase [Rhodobacteraceae bacterium]|nr:N-formylglutamate amidohydrolase [Paracoccaceae bacterium]